jgi:integrase/recombinase XerD
MTLSSVISRYVCHKQSLGYRYTTEVRILRSFYKMVGDKQIENVDAKAVLAFISGKGPITENWVKKYRVLSGFYRYALSRRLVRSSPLPRNVPKPTVVAFIPYIYSHEELKRLLNAIPTVCAGRTPIDEDVLYTFILLLYGTGLRLGEALALTLSDLDLSQAYLHVHKTKFFKSRLVPLGKDLNTLLTEHVFRRNECHNATIDAPLFCLRDGSPLSQSAIGNAFRRMRKYAGVWREGGARRQPRLHDLRHTAAVHRLISWYQNGSNLQDMLPKLATYLGHVDLSSTQRYLTMTPELLDLASRRFEQYAIGNRS